MTISLPGLGARNFPTAEEEALAVTPPSPYACLLYTSRCV